MMTEAGMVAGAAPGTPSAPSSAPRNPAAMSPHPALRTRVTRLFGIDYPIVATGMGYVSDARLTAATSAAGGLGILASALMSYEELVEAIAEDQSLTGKPFGVNVRADQPDVDKRIDLLIRSGVKVASFALGAPAGAHRAVQGRRAGRGAVDRRRRHAEKVKAWGADAVVVQGAEGGGHTGVVPTSLLLPQVAAAVDIAVIGAGGFFDGRGLVAALAYGAAGIAMGTRFLLTRESPVADAVKQLYLTKKVTDTVVTSELDGVPQRLLNAGPDGADGAGAARRLAPGGAQRPAVPPDHRHVLAGHDPRGRRDEEAPRPAVDPGHHGRQRAGPVPLGAP